MKKAVFAAVLLLVFPACAYCGGAYIVNFPIDDGEGRGLISLPEGEGPFPAVVYAHGKVIDTRGYTGAVEAGYDIEGICEAIAENGYLVFAPIRESGRGNIPGHKHEVSGAIDYISGRPDVIKSEIALMGFSRGGLLTLMLGVERSDLSALLILAPAPGLNHFEKALGHVSYLNSPVLLLVGRRDSAHILEDVDILEKALEANGKEYKAIRYNTGSGHKLFWNAGPYLQDIFSFLRRPEGLYGKTLRLKEQLEEICVEAPELVAKGEYEFDEAVRHESIVEDLEAQAALWKKEFLLYEDKIEVLEEALFKFKMVIFQFSFGENAIDISKDKAYVFRLIDGVLEELKE